MGSGSIYHNLNLAPFIHTCHPKARRRELPAEIAGCELGGN